MKLLSSGESKCQAVNYNFNFKDSSLEALNLSNFD